MIAWVRILVDASIEVEGGTWWAVGRMLSVHSLGTRAVSEVYCCELVMLGDLERSLFPAGCIRVSRVFFVMCQAIVIKPAWRQRQSLSAATSSSISGGETQAVQRVRGGPLGGHAVAASLFISVSSKVSWPPCLRWAVCFQCVVFWWDATSPVVVLSVSAVMERAVECWDLQWLRYGCVHS
jgi:hypothetical protein